MNTVCEYASTHYGVPACIGRRVEMNGRPGILAEDCGHHLGINFDDDKPGHISHAHPTWKMEYFGLGKIRKPTRSQKRYQDYLKCSWFDSFRDFLMWRECERKEGINK